MSLIYLPNRELYTWLSCEPYASLTYQFNKLRSFDQEKILITAPNNFEGTNNESGNTNNYNLSFDFHDVSAQTGVRNQFMIRMTYSTSLEGKQFEFYQKLSERIHRQSKLYFIPEMQLNIGTRIDHAYNIQIDALLSKDADLLISCYSMINQLVSILTAAH